MLRRHEFLVTALFIMSLVGISGAQATPASPKPKPTTPPPAPKDKQFLLEVFQLPLVSVDRRQDGISTSVNMPVTNAAQIVAALGSDDAFKLQAAAPDKIAIYYKGSSRPSANPPGLANLKGEILKLANPGFHYSEILRVRRGQASSVAKNINSLTLPGITAQAVGSSEIALLSPGTPDPSLLADLRRRIYRSRWELESSSPAQRVFHLDASSVVKSLAGSADGSTSGGGDKASSDKGSDKSGDKSSEKSSPASSNGSKDSTVSASSTASPTVSATPTISVTVSSSATQAPKPADDSSGSDATTSADSKKPSDKTSTTSADKSSDQAPKIPRMQAVGDVIVYSNPDGSDDGIMERNRLLAILDLPRPEVLLNLWSFQASSGKPEVINTDAEVARQLVEHHNERLQRAIDRGWSYLSQRMNFEVNDKAGVSRAKEPAAIAETDPDFFDSQFYSYITQKFAKAEKASLELKDASSGYSKALADLERRRTEFGWCAADQYCLGFAHAFEPLRPTFTNILLTIIASKHPKDVAERTIEAMSANEADDRSSPSSDENTKCVPKRNEIKKYDDCLCKAKREISRQMEEGSASDCQLKDRLDEIEDVAARKTLSVRLHCLQNQAKVSFDDEKETYATTRVGLLRAAVADFLFNYKWATQYPHDFVPYDLSQSAQELNAEFNPLILEFNRDVAAFTQNLQQELQCKQALSDSEGWFGKSNGTFLNDAMVGVRGISGVESIVDTVTQSFFDATNPPSLTDLVKSVSDAESKVPGVLKTNLTANEAAVLIGALNSVQPAKAKIGRELKLDITPHALAGASSAELDVKLTAGESADPTRFTADKSSEDNLSRVAKHDTTTKVRVDSLKLFEISAFSAMLQRPRSKFPILPPLFEVPYFGSFISFPIPGAKVYHRSSAIVSAIIVPTAADLAYGIDFTADRVCEGSGQSVRCHRAISPSDFEGSPLRNFNKAIVQCFASAGSTPHTGTLTFNQRLKPSERNEAENTVEAQQMLATALNDRAKQCANLSFASVPPSD